MARAPFQVLVFPYRRRADGTPEYGLFERADLGIWQGVAGGGEDDEAPEQAAARELEEEAGIPRGAHLLRLATVGAVAVEHFHDRALWDPELRTIPEYCFAAEVSGALLISGEHRHAAWLPFEEAHDILEWESNRGALRELNACLLRGVDARSAERMVQWP